MKNNFLQEAYGGLREARSKHYCLGLPRKWKVMTSTLLLLFTFAIGNVWAEEVKLVSEGTTAISKIAGSGTAPAYLGTIADPVVYKSADESYSVAISTNFSVSEGSEYKPDGSTKYKDYYYNVNAACDMSADQPTNYIKVAASNCKISKIVVRAECFNSSVSCLTAAGFVSGLPEKTTLGSKQGRIADIIIDDQSGTYNSSKKFEYAATLTYSFSTNVTEVYFSKQIKLIGTSTSESFASYPSSSQSSGVFGIDVYVVPEGPKESAINYTNLKGADNSANPTKYAEGTGIASFTDLADVTGYSFAGWDPASISASATGEQTINATWTANTHSLTWNIPGDATITNSETYTHGTVAYGTTIVAPTLSRAGYDFLGWDATPAATMPDNDLEYTATWQTEAQKFDITYSNLKGSDVSAYPTKYSKGIGIAEFAPLADVEGFHFTGWSPASISTTDEGDKEIEAQWIPTYSVTYNLNGGTGTLPTETAKYATQEFALAAQGDIVAPANKQFLGWKDQDGNKYAAEANFTMPGKAVTLTVYWGAKIESVIYSWESPEGTPIETGGTAKFYNGDTDASSIAAPDNRVNYANKPIDGDVVTQYYTLRLDKATDYSAEHVRIALDDALAAGDKIKITAYYTKNQEKTVAPKIANASDEVVCSTDNLVNLYNGGTPVTQTKTLNDKAEGATTLKLTRSATSTTAFITKLQIIRESYIDEDLLKTVTFNYNDGVTPNATIQVASGQAVAQPANPTWAHHRFNEWQLAGSAYDFSSAVTTDIILVANWTQLYTITYAAGDGTATGDAPVQEDKAQGETFTVAANSFDVAGKDFVKWNDGTKDYAPNDTYTVGSANVVLTAQWEVQASNDATLKALSVTGLTLSPTFAAATVDYTVTKAYGADDPAVSDVTATPTADGASAEVEWDGTNKKFTITVTAVDNTTKKEYTITVNEAAAPKSLSRVLFSNGFDAFIDNTNHTVKAYYLSGTAEPTATTITAGDGTAGALSEGKIRVTGADDSYVDYIVTLEAVTPNTTTVAEEAAAGEFAGDEAWVKNGLLVYGNAAGYSAGDKWYVNRRLKKGTDPENDQRVIAGWVRSYFFVGNAYKFILTVSNHTDIKYSIDGGEQVASDAATVEITLPAGNHMIEIVSNQSNGDCRLSAPKLVERPATYSVTYKAGEGTGDDVIDAFEYAAGDEVTVQANAFTAPANKKFNGWASAPAVTISEGKFEMPASNVVLTAQWKEYFTITYMDGGNTLGTEEVFTDATPAGIADPSKAGYDFAGWVDGEDNPVTIASLSATTTVYAKWTEDPCPSPFSLSKVVLTSASDGTVTGYNGNEYAGEKVISGLSSTETAEVDASHDGTETGYKLNNGGSAIVFATLKKGTFQVGDRVVVTITKAQDAYKVEEVAQPILDIYYGTDKNDATFLTTIENVTAAGSYTYRLTAADVTAIGTKKGIGVFRPGSGRTQNPYVYSVEIKGCRSFAVMHTLTFKNIDGTATIAAESLEEGAYGSTVAPAAPKIAMKRFIGWSESKGGTPVDLTSYTITEDKTLYAVYEDIVCPTKGTVYSLAFDATATAGEGVEYTVNKNNDDVQIPSAIAAISGGEAYFGTTANSDVTILVKDGETEFRRNNSNNYMHLVVECPLQVGDTIAFTSSTTRELIFYKNAPSGTSVTSNSQKIIITDTEHALYGAEVIYIKGGNAACSVKTINITRPAIYDVTFNMMGHGDQVAAIEDVLEGHKIAAPSPAPTDADYRFGGWYKDNTLESEWDFDNDVVTDNITLYAKWVDKSDATLKSLKYGTTEIALEAGVYTYAVNLSPLATDVPALTAVPSNPNATADVTNAAALDGEGHATSKVVVTPELGGTPQTYWVNFTKLHIYTELADVTETTSWDWNGVATDEVKINDVAVRGLILANYIDAPNFEKLEGQENARAYRSNEYPAYQGTYLRFHATKPGKLTINARNSSGSPKLYVNGGDPIATLSGTRTNYNVIVPAGDVIITSTDGEMRIYNMTYKLLEELTPDYTRPVTEGRFGTICLPNGGVMVGAELFEIAYYGQTSEKIFFDNIPSGEMEAGIPYIFLPKAGVSQLGVFYTDAANASAGSRNGLIGSYTQETITPDDDNYILLNNQYCKVVSTEGAVYVGANRAYIHLTSINPTEPALAPGRRRISMGVQSQNAATGMDELNASETPVKMLIDGQLFILRGEKMYNANGQLVK